MENILIWLVIGGVAGWLAGLIVKGYGFGIVGDIVIGMIGAVVGGWLFGQAGVMPGSGLLGAIVASTVGAVVVLLVIGFVRRIA